MNLAINQFLKLFSFSIFCTALLFSAPVLSLDTDGDGIEDVQDKDDDADGLPDTWETANGHNPNAQDYLVRAGARYTCTLDGNGLVCWGDNEITRRETKQT